MPMHATVYTCIPRDVTWVNCDHPASTISHLTFGCLLNLQTADILLMSRGYWAQLQVIVGVRGNTFTQKLML